MSQLSGAAKVMLSRGVWHEAARRRPAIIERVHAAGYPWFEPVVTFQERYGGLEYHVEGSNRGFRFDMFIGYQDGEAWAPDWGHDAQGRVIDRATDDYTTWWWDEQSRIVRNVAHVRRAGTDRAFCYFRNGESANEFAGQARGAGFQDITVHAYPD
jgi:hypothetical protein